MTCLDSDPTLGCCLGHAQNFWDPELAEEAERFKEHPRSRPMPATVTTTMLVRRDVMERVGSLDASLGHGDTADWVLRAQRAGIGVRILPEVLLHRRMHGASRSRTSAAASRGEFLRILKRKLDEGRQHPPPPREV